MKIIVRLDGENLEFESTVSYNGEALYLTITEGAVLQKVFDDVESQIDSLKDDIRACERQIETLEGDIEDYMAEVRDLQSRINND